VFSDRDCPASGSTNSYHITAPDRRYLVCAKCTGVWVKQGESMRLPMHIDTGTRSTRSEIVALLERAAEANAAWMESNREEGHPFS
jgi:hypothetical protein